MAPRLSRDHGPFTRSGDSVLPRHGGAHGAIAQLQLLERSQLALDTLALRQPASKPPSNLIDDVDAPSCGGHDGRDSRAHTAVDGRRGGGGSTIRAVSGPDGDGAGSGETREDLSSSCNGSALGTTGGLSGSDDASASTGGNDGTSSGCTGGGGGGGDEKNGI